MISRAVAAAVLLSMTASAALAGTTGPEQPTTGPASPPEKLGTLSLVVENDFFAGTDRNYTNGFRVAWLRPKGHVSDATAWLGRVLLGINDRADLYEGLAVGQNLYTPSDITVAAPQPGDHPYAGWLYLELAAIADAEDSIDTLTVNAGVVGPLALGEFVQNSFHQLIDSDIAQGWDNQIANEPGLVVSFDRTWRPWKQTRDWGFDLLPSAGISLGNVLTQGQAGLTVRLGPDLRDDPGPPRIRPSLAGGGFLDEAGGFDWYFHFGAQGRAVARDIVLDGNTFRSGPSVDKRNFVHDLQFGAVARLDGLRLSWSFVRRSPDFVGQSQPQVFAAITLTARY